MLGIDVLAEYAGSPHQFLFQICGTVLVPVHHLLDSASTELRNFLLVVILAHIDLNLPRGESTVVDADSGNSAVCVTTLACSSGFFTSS